MKATSCLAEEWRLGALVIPNRVVMAPMSSNRADREGAATPWLVRFLVRRARRGCMVIAESATVDFATGGGARTLRLDQDACIPGLRVLVDALNQAGAVAVAQIWHAGPRAANGRRVALPCPPTAYDPEEIVRWFVEAGCRAGQAGFDALEVHAAHGYLLHHFADRVTNTRTDGYGGDLRGRYRILAEIRAGLRRSRPNIPVLLRLSVREDDDHAAIAGAVQEAGYDGLDVRTGFSSMPTQASGEPVPACYTVPLATRFRPHLTIPLLTGGRILTPVDAERAIGLAGLDAVILGRPLLADPNWPRKAIAGEAITPCLYDCYPSCYSRFKEGYPLRCVHYGRRG